MKSSEQFKFVTREWQKVAFRIYLFLIQRKKKNSKTNSGICGISYKQARLADNIISRKYSCEKLKLMLSCYVNLVSVSFSSIS